MNDDFDGYGRAALLAETDVYSPPLKPCVDCGRLRFTRRRPALCLDCILARAQAEARG